MRRPLSQRTTVSTRLCTRLVCHLFLLAGLTVSVSASTRPVDEPPSENAESTNSTHRPPPLPALPSASQSSEDTNSSVGKDRVGSSHPWVFSLGIAFVVLVTGMRWRNMRKRGWATARPSHHALTQAASVEQVPRALSDREQAAQDAAKKRAAVYQHLGELRSDDPHFSFVLLEDFLHALYSGYQCARAGKDRRAMRAYLTPRIKKTLKKTGLSAVRDISIGAITILRAQRVRREDQPHLRITVRFEATITEERGEGQTQRIFLEDTWQLARLCSANSRPPERSSIRGCPCCGGSITKLAQDNVCRSCKTTLKPGAFDWAVEDISSQQSLEPPESLCDESRTEIGTDMATMVSEGMWERYSALAESDPHFSWPKFEHDIAEIFRALHAGWRQQDLISARAYLCDRLYEMQQYWTTCYRTAGLSRKTEDTRITDIQIADVRDDHVFDTVTVRIYVSGIDYTVTEQGSVVGGSQKIERDYSEYWTLIRANGVKTANEDSTDCPNCSHSLDVSAAGHCNHCDAHLSSGQFHWVLARIEQDESYI